MELRLEHSDYAKVTAVASAVVFVICALIAFDWYNKRGFDLDTSIALSCALVSAAILIISSWILARNRRSERLENVDIVYRYVPGDEKAPKEPEKPATEYKMPKH